MSVPYDLGRQIGPDVIQMLCDDMTASQQLSVLKEKLDRFPNDYLHQMPVSKAYCRLTTSSTDSAMSHWDFDYCFARGFVAAMRHPLARVPRWHRNSTCFDRAQVRQVTLKSRYASVTLTARLVVTARLRVSIDPSKRSGPI